MRTSGCRRPSRRASRRRTALLASKPSLILLLGTDGDKTAARADARRSDSILLVRTDPGRHRLAYLSIPRDLRVDIPGHGPNKINAAFQLGGPVPDDEDRPRTHRPAAEPRRHRRLRRLPRASIDALGGVEIDVPKPILSNRFDCPYATEARCQQWQGWRFAKGKQKMNGQRALIYSRVRENRLDPSDNDLTRGERQQDVVEAMTDKLVGPGTFVRLPFIGGDLVAAADDRPLDRPAAAARLGQVPRQRGPRAPLPARRRESVHRRPIRHRRDGGEHRRDRDVHRPLGAAAAAARTRPTAPGCLVGRSSRF